VDRRALARGGAQQVEGAARLPQLERREQRAVDGEQVGVRRLPAAAALGQLAAFGGGRRRAGGGLALGEEWRAGAR
jgi:hypothetical protein